MFSFLCYINTDYYFLIIVRVRICIIISKTTSALLYKLPLYHEDTTCIELPHVFLCVFILFFEANLFISILLGFVTFFSFRYYWNYFQEYNEIQSCSVLWSSLDSYLMFTAGQTLELNYSVCVFMFDGTNTSRTHGGCVGWESEAARPRRWSGSSLSSRQ